MVRAGAGGGYLKLEGRREVVTPGVNQCDSTQGEKRSQVEGCGVCVFCLLLHNSIPPFSVPRDEITHEQTWNSHYAPIVP